MANNILINIFKHLKLIMKHKYLVFKLSIKIGIPFRGLVHDLSKFSATEFGESIKYYNGKRSPISVCKEKNGYSKAWLHHKGRNKHHLEYWVDLTARSKAPVIPYKYLLEMICDKLSASIVYEGKNWTNSSQYKYWQKEREREILNPKVQNFFDKVFLEVKENGIEQTLTKQNMRDWYKKYCIDDKTEYEYEFHGEWKKIN